jgi:hypothetical protein
VAQADPNTIVADLLSGQYRHPLRVVAFNTADGSHLNDPEYWRDRAKEARVIAEDMADPVYKQKMLDVAASYPCVSVRSSCSP